MKKSKNSELSLSGMFYRRRDEWIRYVISLPKDDLTATEKAVAVRIVIALNPQEQVYVLGQARIADDLGIAVQTVKNAVLKLKRLGLIEAKRVSYKQGARPFNSYEMVAPQDAFDTTNVLGKVRQ